MPGYWLPGFFVCILVEITGMEAFIYSLLGAAAIGLTSLTYRYPITGRIISASIAGGIALFFVCYLMYNQGRTSLYRSFESTIIDTNIDSVLFKDAINGMDTINARNKKADIRDAYVQQVRQEYKHVQTHVLFYSLHCLLFILILGVIFALSFIFQSLIKNKIEKEENKPEQKPS
jgi:hypothetical protein